MNKTATIDISRAALADSTDDKVLARLNAFYIFLQLAMLLAFIIALAAGTPSDLKNSASFVFSDFQNTGFWTNKYVLEDYLTC